MIVKTLTRSAGSRQRLGVNITFLASAGFWRRAGLAADFFRCAHGVESAGDDLGGASAIHLVRCFRLEQLGVRENDAELIIEAMKEES